MKKKKGFKAITDSTDLDKLHPFFKRKEGDFGTDKFILGLDPTDDWENIVIEETVNSYMYAILNNSLKVQVGNVEISKKFLESVIDRIKEFNPESPCIEYYLTLTSKDAIEKVEKFKTEDGKYETMKLRLFSGETFHRKVQLIRGTGIEIYDKDRFRAPYNFAGTLIVEGEN